VSSTKVPLWLFDLDGTLALKGDRSPYDWSRVGEDLPNAPVVAVHDALLGVKGGAAVGYVSGRMEQCRVQTAEWLLEHTVQTVIMRLWMRPDGDMRPDQEVKQEIYHRDIEPRYDVQGVFDDRDRVVKMWRALGLPCFQVAEGDF